VGRMVNEFFRRGAEVFYRERDGVHVSGHGSAGDLAIMLNLVRPRVFAPVHGEYRHLVAHARIAAEAGMPADRVFVLEPGEPLEVSGGKGRRGAKVAAGRMLVDGDTVGDGAGAVVRERRKLAREGLVVVVAVPRHPVFVVSVGVLPEAEARELDAQAAGVVSQALDELRRQGAPVDVLREEVHDKARAVYRRALQKKPRVLTVVMEE
jgi:ribonuclease J